MRFISWKKVKSLKCLTCGECCKYFDVPLKPKEYARIVKIFNSEVFLSAEKTGGVFFNIIHMENGFVAYNKLNL
ncbi:MAG: YkgJ family cysteine cluster protein [Candidatus Heimdallarchaeota archaeon]